MIIDLPTTMHAVAIDTPGGPEVLKLTSVPTPEPRTGKVLIRVFAAGLNRPDVLQRLGMYQLPPDADPLPGLEVAGEICGLGEGATRWHIGDKVMALARDGRYIIIAFLGGPGAEPDLRAVLGKRLTITGSTLRPQTIEEKRRSHDNSKKKCCHCLNQAPSDPSYFRNFPSLTPAMRMP